MATIVTRAGKGSPLTHTEVDANFTNLNTDKVESSALATVATSGAYGDLSGVPTLATVATSGAYGDLSGLPTLGTAAATAATDYATAAQGALADSSTQPGDNVSTLTNDAGYSTTTGTVTNVGGTGAVNGLSLSGTVTSSGNLTLGGTLAISNADWSGTDLSVANGGTGASTLAANNVLLGNGASALQTVAPGASGNVLTSNGTTWQSTAPAAGGGTLEATASGALANGDLVVVNSDGTVSVVAETVVTPTNGTPVQFNGTDATDDMIAAYDPVASKVLIVFKDADNAGYGTAIVGTVSGTSINFGTPTVFLSAQTNYPVASYDPNSGSFLVVYQDGLANGRAKLATISGTSVSFGSTFTFLSGQVSGVNVAYNSTQGKHLIVYRNAGSSFRMEAKVATVSGSSVSFGSAVSRTEVMDADFGLTYQEEQDVMVLAWRDNTFSVTRLRSWSISGTTPNVEGTVIVINSQANLTRNSITYDPVSKKLLFVTGNPENSDYGTAWVVAMTAPSSFSVQSNTVFESSAIAQASVGMHLGASKFSIVYRTSSLFTRYASISGSTLTFDTRVTLQSGSTKYNSQAYDSDTQQMVLAYRDNSTADEYGEALMTKPGFTSVNLTSTNFIGISDGAYADAATATVQIVGSVDDAQSGLTAGQEYYVQVDGTLSTTAGSPSVRAGTAVSATKLIVKG